MIKNVSGKTGATTATGVAGGAGIAPLIVWILGQVGVDMPPEIATIVGGLVAGALSFLVAWLVPATSGTYVQAGEPFEGFAEEEDLDFEELDYPEATDCDVDDSKTSVVGGDA